MLLKTRNPLRGYLHFHLHIVPYSVIYETYEIDD